MIRGAALLATVVLAACSRPAAQPAKAQAAPDPLRIAMFYANPATPAQGEKTLLCYSVENATSVRLDPPVDRIWPSPNHCLEVPTRKATYTLTAERGGERVSKSVSVEPIPPRVMLFATSVSKNEIKPGEAVSVCFNAVNAVRVTITPGVWVGRHGPALGCVKDSPAQDTTYVITARGAGGDVSTEEIAVHVKSN